MQKLVSILLALVLMISGVAYAEHEDDVTKTIVKAGVSAAFEEAEKQIIYKYFKGYVKEEGDHEYDHDYYKDKSKHKKKKKGLPPGIAKNLERGKPLPPGIAKRYLPNDLNHQLPPPPYGYERRIVDNDVLLVEVDTGKIADILTDVLLGE